jgi:cysteine desulfurase/selenocysteine lyase
MSATQNIKQIGELIGNVDAFPILGKWDFYNHAGVSPLPTVCADEFRAFASQAESAAYLEAQWHPNIDKLRHSSAELLNAQAEEIAFIKNTGEGLSIVSKGLEWRRGDRIITTGVEYPANIYPWMEACRAHGAELVLVKEEDALDGSRHVPMDRIFEAASHPATRLLTLSHVEFGSGQRHDLARIGQFCAERKILFCVDGIQSLGVVPVDVRQMNIDFLSADGHKWLLGPEGAGIFFCRHERLEQLRPLAIGWMNVVKAQDFGHYDYTLKPDSRRFECGSHNVPGLLALKASLELLKNAGIENVAQRIKTLTDILIEGLRAKGYHIISPRTADQWSGIVSFTSSKHDHESLLKQLRQEHRIEIAVRVGRLRCSPHFYNTTEQMQKLVDVLPSH